MDFAKLRNKAIKEWQALWRSDETLILAEEDRGWLGKDENFSDKRRVEMPCLAVKQRRGNFAEV